MNEHERNEALDKAFDRLTNQLKQLEDERRETTITLRESDRRFQEVRIHYNNAIQEIERTYRKSEAT